MSDDPVGPRIRDLLQVEALLAWEQERYRGQLTAWCAGDRAGPPPPVPETYREALARLQIALGRFAIAREPGGQHEWK